jgi:hypothetical protein
MSSKNDYSDKEWKAISTAPVAAGLLITASDESGLAMEAIAVGKAISKSALGDAPEIVKALANNVKASGGTPELPELPTGDRAETKEALIGIVRAAVGALQARSPVEAESYKAWLASVTAKVAHASKEKRCVGIGRALPSADEEEALRLLADVLGVNAPAPPSRRGEDTHTSSLLSADDS